MNNELRIITDKENDVDKLLKAADAIAKVFDETTEGLDPKRAAVIKILKELVAPPSNVPVEAPISYISDGKGGLRELTQNEMEKY